MPTDTPFGCDTARASFGGQPTIADFTGDGTLEVGVSGSLLVHYFDVNTMEASIATQWHPPKIGLVLQQEVQYLTSMEIAVLRLSLVMKTTSTFGGLIHLGIEPLGPIHYLSRRQQS